jgi:hypothetical protein
MALTYKPLITIKEKTDTEPAIFQSLSTEVEGTDNQVKITPVSSSEFNGEDYQVGVVDNVILPGEYVGIPKVTTLPINPPLSSFFIFEKTV